MQHTLTVPQYCFVRECGRNNVHGRSMNYVVGRGNTSSVVDAILSCYGIEPSCTQESWLSLQQQTAYIHSRQRAHHIRARDISEPSPVWS